MLPIFGDEGLQRRVVQKLQACLPVLVYKTDPLPKQICQFCAARLDDAYEFREYCLNVYKSMHAMLLKYQQSQPVRVFLRAMKTSQDPCQVCSWIIYITLLASIFINKYIYTERERERKINLTNFLSDLLFKYH